MSRLENLDPRQREALDTELDPDLHLGVGSAATADSGSSEPVSGTTASAQTQAAPGCNNGERDPDESDVDCGGYCGACRDGKRCGAGAHCESGVCNTAGFCEAPSCSDATQNGNETALDCGGGTCPPCINGASCDADRDCTTGYCKAGACADARCSDGALNGEETDVDCGGLCPRCVANERCSVASDCESLVCISGEGGSRCRVATCDDGAQNGDESDVDCGGSCGGCNPDQTCANHADCISDLCAGVCLAPGCNDGVHNADESDVDCGGSCTPCAAGKLCTGAADCASAACEATCQPGAPGAACSTASDCITGNCSASFCGLGTASAPCVESTDCESGLCSNGSCALAEVGGNCSLDADCTSGHCAGTCQPGSIGAACHDAGDCLTNSCGTSLACSAAAFEVETRGDRGGTDRLYFNAWITLPAPIPWNDLAFLYFFSPEAAGPYVGYQYNGPGTADPLALQLNTGEWALIWKSTSSLPGPTSAEELIDFQMVRADNSQLDPFIRDNDYSQVAGAKVVNDRVVVCQRNAGRWKHVSGIAPNGVGDACAQVVENCEATQAPCESIPLQ